MIIPRDKVIKVKDAIISPMNIAFHLSINESGEMIEKMRLTHNQSMEFGSGTSINSRLLEDEMQDVMYGPCLSRVQGLSTILWIKIKAPEKKNLTSKS